MLFKNRESLTSNYAHLHPPLKFLIKRFLSIFPYALQEKIQRNPFVELTFCSVIFVVFKNHQQRGQQ